MNKKTTSPYLPALLFGLSALCLSLAGCLGFGYQVGTKSLFAQDVKTVYVPIFESEVGRRDLAERLTEAVCKRIEARSPYKVVGRPSADSVLEGRIVRRSQSMSIHNSNNDPRQKTFVMRVEVRWRDRRDRELQQFESIPWKDSAGVLTSTAYLVPEYGQSEATTEQEQIDTIADQIVGMMETPW